MAGVQIELRFDDVRARRKLREIAEGLEDTLPLMDELGVVLIDGILRRFGAGVGPDGVAWEPSFRARVTGGKTLEKSGRLIGSFTHAPTEDEVRVGTNVPYALIHQVGGEITPQDAGALSFQLADGTFVTVGKVTIPARPYLGFDAEDIAGIEDTILDFVEELLER